MRTLSGFVAVVLMGCSLLTSLTDVSPEPSGADGGDGADAGQPSDSGALQDADGALVDAGSGDGGPGDASAYHDMASLSYWSTFDTTILNASAAGFVGAAFDGRHLYLVPNGYGSPSGVVARFDTQGAFTLSNWSLYNAGPLDDAGAKGFSGGAFDGQFVYLVPSDNGTSDGVVTRYDTKATFNVATSWSTFDTVTVSPTARGFHGAAFDGRYLYLVPHAFGTVAQYDTQAAFKTTTSWVTFDATTVNAAAAGFWGGVFDGRYVYFVPNGLGTSAVGVITRYDTQKSFAALTSWSAFDLAAMDSRLKGFHGGGFDGQYLYLVPANNGALDGVVARYDTKAVFNVSGSWSVFDVATLTSSAKGLWSAAFDGRFMYFSPNANSGGYDGIIARCDTQADFTMAGSWSTFDLTTVNANARGFAGSAFDGRYLYLVPSINGAIDGLVARFDAKNPPSVPPLPPFYSGSFF